MHNEEQDGWHNTFLDLCEFWAKKSKDRSTKVGAVIVGQRNNVLSTGYNGFARHVPDDIEEFHARPMKYLVTEHAERNAIYNAAMDGIRLMGSTLYMPYKPVPCCDCTRAIIQVGIKRIVGSDIDFPGKGDQWAENLRVSQLMLLYAGIECIIINKT